MSFRKVWSLHPPSNQAVRAHRSAFPLVGCFLIFFMVFQQVTVVPAAEQTAPSRSDLRGKAFSTDRDKEIVATFRSAILQNDVETVRRCLDNGADPNDGHAHPLSAAARSNNTDMAQLLVERGAHVNKPGSCSSPPLEAAIIAGHGDIVELLIRHKAHLSCNEEHRNPLTVAVGKRNRAIVDLLLQHGADIESGVPEKPLRTAVQSCQKDMVKFLLDKGADPNATDSRNGASVLGSCRVLGGMGLQSPKEACVAEILAMLIDHGADVNRHDRHGRHAPLAEAIRFGSLTMTRLYLDRGADINHKWKSAESDGFDVPLSHALGRVGCEPGDNENRRKRYEIAKLLLERGAEVDLLDRNLTFSVRRLEDKCAGKFVEFKELVNLVRSKGRGVTQIDGNVERKKLP
ncbi:MAG: ankyrin repeat domain-containing protein [Pseudomonadota bacterium]